MLEGKIAIVAGASRGIGAGIARELAAQGACVILAARTLDKTDISAWHKSGPLVPGTLTENVASISEAGGRAEAYKINLSELDQIKLMIAYVADKHGQIDILVNCAMGFPNDYKGEVWNTDDTAWQAMMEIGVRGKYLATHFVSQVMMRQKSGLIVNISAGASKVEYYNPMFRMAMAAVDRMTAAVAHDLKPHEISAVSIWPRWVRTERVAMAAEDPTLGFDVSKADLAGSDTPEFTGRGIAHLASDPNVLVRSGRIFPIVQLAHDYGFCDIDGTCPDLDPFTQSWSGKLAAISDILDG
jgi:dehydrogenase/reductase SDR family protein 1